MNIQHENVQSGRINSVHDNRRAYGPLVDDAIIEDYALRYSPKEHRKWSEFVATDNVGEIETGVAERSAGNANDWDVIDEAAPRLEGILKRVIQYIEKL